MFHSLVGTIVQIDEKRLPVFGKGLIIHRISVIL